MSIRPGPASSPTPSSGGRERRRWARACAELPITLRTSADGFHWVPDVASEYKKGGERVEGRLIRTGGPLVPVEFQIAIPRHRGQGAMEKRVRIMQKPRQARILDRGETAAGRVRAIDAQHAQPAAAQVGLQNEGVVPGAEDDAVVSHYRPTLPGGLPSLP